MRHPTFKADPDTAGFQTDANGYLDGPHSREILTRSGRQVDPRTVTGRVDNLERDGLVKRVDVPDDRRSVHAELTAQGRERVKALWRGAAGGQAQLTKRFSESELIQLRHLCLRLIRVMGAAEGDNHATS